MSELFAALVGLVGALLLWPALRSVFASPVLRRQNYRGHELPVGSGLVVLVAVLAAAGGSALLDCLDLIDNTPATASIRAATVLTLGTALLGFVDDIVGTGDHRGFRGHLTALAHGEVTSGMLKLAGTPAVALVALWPITPNGMTLLRGAAVVALAANLGNLFDRAPGRTIKVSILAAVPLAIGGGSVVAGPLVVLGAGVGLLRVDLREDAMLGDTGSNALGAAAGALLVVRLGTTGEWIALAGLVALNLASEVVSFSRVIDRIAPLRLADRWGRRPV